MTAAAKAGIGIACALGLSFLLAFVWYLIRRAGRVGFNSIRDAASSAECASGGSLSGFQASPCVDYAEMEVPPTEMEEGGVFEMRVPPAEMEEAPRFELEAPSFQMEARSSPFPS